MKTPDLAVVDLPPVATPLALHPHRMRAALGEAARIEGDDAIGFAQSLGHLTHQYPDQRPVVPWCDTNKVLQDQAFDIDQRRNVLGILAWHVGQQPLEGEVYVALAGLRLKRVLIGYREVTQALNQVVEDIGGNDAIMP